MRPDVLAELLIMFGIALIALACGLWLGAPAAVAVIGVGALTCGLIIARGGIGR